jgi:predicted nucleotidyltransferase
MGRDDVIKTLRDNRAILEEMGVRHVALFGSTARGEAGNDVDLVAEFDDALSLTDVVNIEQTLEQMLGTDVDLVQAGTLKQRVQERIEPELIRAF